MQSSSQAVPPSVTAKQQSLPQAVTHAVETSTKSGSASEQEADTAAMLNNILTNSSAWADAHHIQTKLDYKAYSDYTQMDYDGAFRTLTISANKNDALAEAMLGVIYLKGTTDVRQNPIVGFKWLFKAARQGLPMAQYYLAAYASDKDISAKYKRAAWFIDYSQKSAAWLASVAQSGNAGALKGMNVIQSIDKTANADVPIAPPDASSVPPAQTIKSDSQVLQATDFKSTSFAADKGDSTEQYKLGVLYMQGEDVPQNYIEAYKWLILAKAKSTDGSETYESATASMATLEPMMTKSQVAQAQQEASTWFSGHS